MSLLTVISTSGEVFRTGNLRSLPTVEMTEWNVMWLFKLSFIILLSEIF
jgi:hypothetical protein